MSPVLTEPTRRVRMRAMPGLLAGLLVAIAAPWGARAQEVQYYHLDAIGNVRAVTDATGQVIERHDYLPFGEECTTGPCASNPGIAGGQPKHFTGKERDAETGLDYFGARYYGSGVGRFTSVDPALDRQAALLNPQRWSRYAYVLNNPFRYVDADGRVERSTVDAHLIAQQRAATGYVEQGDTLGGYLAIAGLSITGASVGILAVEAAPALFIEAQIAWGTYLPTRAGQIHGAVGGPVTRSKTTVAIARVTTREGVRQTLVASSERVLRPAQRALLKAGEIPVKGPGHAEVTALNAAKAAGQRVTDVAVSRPVCVDCATAIRAVGARIHSGLKDP
jgi:RHS repeat-associated protein